MSLPLAEAHVSSTEDKLQRVQSILRQFVLRPNTLRPLETGRNARGENFGGLGSITLKYTIPNSAEVTFASERGFVVTTGHHLRSGIDVVSMSLDRYGAFAVRYGDEDSGDVYLPFRWGDGGITLWGGERSHHLGFDVICQIEHEVSMLPEPEYLSEISDKPTLRLVT